MDMKGNFSLILQFTLDHKRLFAKTKLLLDSDQFGTAMGLPSQ